VLAFVGFGLQQGLISGSSQDSATQMSGGAEQAAPQSAAGRQLSLPGGPVPVSETGTDYRADTLIQAAGQRVLADPQLDQGAGDDDFRKSMPSSAQAPVSAAGLDRLRLEEALRACIDAIAAQHGAGEITPQTIDFARFDGAPALIVKFDAAGGSWVWASGPACGTPGVGADKLASVKVG
jgi:hypothetical protein